MTTCSVNYSKRGQMKIQQMAFVLVAVIIFFAMVSLFYFSVSIKNIQNNAASLSQDEARELVRKLASSPEFSWGRGCDSCIDIDKVMALKDMKDYSGFWNLDYLAIEKVYPKGEGECTLANYPECGKITIVDKGMGIPSSAFVSLCRWEGSKNSEKCEIGRIYAGAKSLAST